MSLPWFWQQCAQNQKDCENGREEQRAELDAQGSADDEPEGQHAREGGATADEPERVGEGEHYGREGDVVLYQRAVAEKIRIEAEKGGGDDGGDSAGELPCPESDERGEGCRDQGHGDARVPDQSVGIVSGSAVNDQNAPRPLDTDDVDH